LKLLFYECAGVGKEDVILKGFFPKFYKKALNCELVIL